MRSRGIQTRRRQGKWAIRALLALLLTVIAWRSVAWSYAQVIVSRDPELAYRLAPGDGRIAGRLAAALVADTSNAQWRRAHSIAVHALLEDPTSIGAVTTLALEAMSRQDSVAAAHRFGYAQRLTRRDPRTQLWAIEEAVSHGSVSATLHQYDIALRTRPEMSAVLFPVLISGIADVQVRRELLRILATKPVWGADFTAYAVEDSSAGEVLPPLLLELHRAGVPVSSEAHRVAIDHLLQGGDFQDAWNYYSNLRPGSEQLRSRDPSFKGEADGALQFDWNLSNDSGMSTAIGSNSLDWSVAPTVGGQLLRQTLVLPEGVYHLSVHGSGVDVRQSDRPYWTLRCSDGRELGRVVLVGALESEKMYSGNFNVPADCRVQQLLLVARPTNTSGGLSGTFDHVQLEPAM